MSQSVPLTKLLPQYNDVVETFQRRMQEDNTHHLENMLNTYTHALQGGASAHVLSYLERKLANRDNYTHYRTHKDAMEWMSVDKKMHSYLGKNMAVLAGGEDPTEEVPASKEPQLVQSLKLLSAFINNLTEKMMTARQASMQEFREAVDQLLRDSKVSERIKSSLLLLVEAAAHKYQENLDRDASELLMLEYLTTHRLAPATSGCILRSGICKNLPEQELPYAQQLLVAEEKGPVMAVRRLEGGGSCGASTAAYSSQSNQSSHQDNQSSHQGNQSSHQESHAEKGPKFRSHAAEQLYNIISQ